MTPYTLRLRTAVATALLAATALAASPALAASTTSTAMPVSATVPNSCSASTTGNMSFGTLAASLTVAQTDTTGTISVTCLNGGTYTIIADTGLYVSGTQRQMSKNGMGGPYLTYNVYSDSGRSVAYPTAVGSATIQTGTGSAQAYTIYGRLNSQTATAAGTYTDTLGFTITY